MAVLNDMSIIIPIENLDPINRLLHSCKNCLSYIGKSLSNKHNKKWAESKDILLHFFQ